MEFRDLANNQDPSLWYTQHTQYEHALRLKRKGETELQELDRFRGVGDHMTTSRIPVRWLFHTLPSTTIAARDPPHCTAAELVDLVRWKLMRGKNRPALLGYAKAHADATVIAATTNALAALGPSPASKASITAAVQHLTTLRGVGVATASALLAAVDPTLPFMSDEAIDAACGDTHNKRQYTLDCYLRVVDWARKQATVLNNKQGMEPSKPPSGSHLMACAKDAPCCAQQAYSTGFVFQAREVERAWWTDAVCTRLQDDKQAAKSKRATQQTKQAAAFTAAAQRKRQKT